MFALSYWLLHSSHRRHRQAHRPCAGRIGGIYNYERIPGERSRRPFAERHSFEPGIFARGSLVVRVEYSMAIEKSVHGRWNADAALRRGTAKPLLEIVRIGRVQAAGDVAGMRVTKVSPT